jgi:hypothetical protein
MGHPCKFGFEIKRGGAAGAGQAKRHRRRIGPGRGVRALRIFHLAPTALKRQPLRQMETFMATRAGFWTVSGSKFRGMAGGA